jgi:hypothetical protein
MLDEQLPDSKGALDDVTQRKKVVALKAKILHLGHVEEVLIERAIAEERRALSAGRSAGASRDGAGLECGDLLLSHGRDPSSIKCRGKTTSTERTAAE